MVQSTFSIRPITKENPYRICFVCLGNICRSPTAEGVFQRLVLDQGLGEYFEIDSAGTSAYHLGEPANSKSRMVAERHGTELNSRARMFESRDLEYFDMIIVMDFENLDNVKSLDKQAKYRSRVTTLRAFDPEPGDGQVPDPYYGGLNGFEKVYAITLRSCKALLERLGKAIKED